MQQEERQRRLTRREKRLLRQQGKEQENHQERFSLKLKHFEPLTQNQRYAFESFAEDKNLMFHGIAGTGKSFMAMYLSLKQILNDPNCIYKKIVIVRTVVPTRDMGFLPGNNKEKSAVYEVPYQTIFSELFNRGDAYQVLKQKDFVEFMTTSFVRGITLSDCILIIDEIQNMNASELHSIFTRIGKNCRVILCGDIKKNDLQKHREQSGFSDFFKILNRMNQFKSIEFTKTDIVRSDIVREYIITRENLEEAGEISPL